MFFTYSALFYYFLVLQILSFLFICKLFLEIKKNSSPSWESLFRVEVNYFNRDTNFSNQLMMIYVWRSFQVCGGRWWKTIRECQTLKLGDAHAPKEIFKDTQASKLGDHPVHPPLHQKLSVRPSFHHIFITSCVMCYAWSVSLFTFLSLFSFACC